MRNSFIFCVYFSLIIKLLDCSTIRPIIGVLSQDVNKYSVHGDSFILATYVKFLEQAGARVVPIKIFQSEQYYRNLLSKLNGVLFPGGEASLHSSGFATAGKYIFDIAKEINDAGEVFPVWGTCLGFEYLADLASQQNIVEKCEGHNMLSSMELASGSNSSELLRALDRNIMEAATKYTLLAFNHGFCVTEEAFNANDKLRSFFKVDAYAYDANRVKFVAAMEGIQYPFYGVQWHPEKSSYTWDLNQNVNHSLPAVLMGQQLANFFVQKAQLNNHSFSSVKKEKSTD